MSLKGSACPVVGFRCLWVQYVFGQPFWLGSVRYISFFSHLEVALSAYLHCHQPPTCSLGRDLCGSYFGSPPLPSASWRVVWAFLSPLELTLCTTWFVCPARDFVCPSFSPQGPPSVPQGLCALQRFVCALCLSHHAPLTLYTARFVCTSEVCMLRLSQHPLPCRASVGFSGFPRHTV